MAALKENSRLVLDYVKTHDGENFTAIDIAEALGLTAKQVNGIVTSAFQRKKLMQRVEAEVEVEDGKHKTVKFIQLTDDGRAFDPDAAADAE